MSETVEVDLARPSNFGLAFLDDCRSVFTLFHSMLLEGPEASTTAVLLFLQPFLRAPVVWTPARGPLELPTGECGAVVLHEVAALSRDDQRRLVEWLDRPSHSYQVISTTTESLFRRVECGQFDAVLYYRLNVMLLRVEPNGDRRPRRPDATEEVTPPAGIQPDRSESASRRTVRGRPRMAS